ncbi:MAG TPA: tRNA threonylcarbamoyladenosine dehydratase [Ruminococcaceae bacterium]|nr:tRNA threonylcarbamoyladenosine dehydratase [Oscillospiraceae bacterium]
MEEAFIRSAMLMGEEKIEKLKKSRVLLFGVGGVGSFAAEALARSGIGCVGLCDNDTVSVSNLNRQLVATHSTVGQAKTHVAAERMRDINPSMTVIEYPFFFDADTAEKIPFAAYDYIIDAIDTVSAKLLLIEKANAFSIPIISCMGTGNKLDPTALCVTDIGKTSGCPLAKVMRCELRKRGITSLKVVFSAEPPQKPLFQPTGEDVRRATPGSVPFVPPVAGMIAAGEAIKHLADMEENI